jgi:hypothetical protein
MENVEGIRLELALAISTLERELERAALGKDFVRAEREVALALEAVRGLVGIAADNLRYCLVVHLVIVQIKVADDVPCAEIRIVTILSPLAAGII